MTYQAINMGTSVPNDGETLFSYFTKADAMFSALYTGTGTVSHAVTDVASASTCDIGAAATNRVRITGNVTITSLGTSANKIRFVHFDAAPLLTYNASSLILPGAANIQAAAGDCAIFSSDASGNWRCLIWQDVTGRGNVTGPSSSTDNALARFDGTTGELIQNSTVTLSDTGVLGGAKVTPTGASATRTLESKLSDFVSVFDFGAVGDGSTDDSTAFTNALATGKRVWAPWTVNGYSFGTNFVAVDDGQYLLGENQVKIKGTGDKLIRMINYDEQATIEGLTFDMTGASAGSTAIRFGTSSANVWRTRLLDLRFENCYEAIGTETHASNYVVDLDCRDIQCLYPKSTQIYIPRSRGFMQFKQFFIDCTLSASPRVSWVSAKFEDFIGLELTEFDVVGQGAIQGTPAYDANAVGIRIDGTGTPGSDRFVWLDRVRVESSEGPGIYILDTTFVWEDRVEAFGCLGLPIYHENCSIIEASNIYSRGMSGETGAAASANGIGFTGCSKVLGSNFGAEECTGHGILCHNTTDCHITGIRCENNDLYGIADTGTSDRNVFLNCRLNGNTSGASSLAGASSRVVTGLLLVDGPASATSGNLASYSGTSGKVIQDAGTPSAVIAGAAGANGLIVRTSASALAARTLTAPAAGITVTDGNGVSGNPTLVLANDLAAVEGLSANGLAYRSATDTWSTVSYTPATSWTPAIAFGGGATGVTYAGQFGSYVRIGDEVIAYFYLELTSNGTSTGSVTITGLPVTSVNQTYNFGAVSLLQGASGMIGLSGPILGRVGPNVATCSLFAQGATGTSALTEANVSDTAAIMGTIRYRV